MAQLEFRLLGGLQISRDGQAVPPPTPQRAALLARLLLFGERPQPRQMLAGLFWGDLPEAKARHNLSGVLHDLHTLLDPPGTPKAQTLFQADTTYISLNPAASVWVDARAFLDLVRPGVSLEQLREAVELYSGELLPGLYDDWLLLERERLAGLYRQALTRLISHYQASGEVEQALDLAQRLVAADPLQEDASRTLMKLYYQLGRRDRALAVYQSLRQKLAADLELEPEAATTALFQSIQARLPEAAALAAPPAS